MRESTKIRFVKFLTQLLAYAKWSFIMFVMIIILVRTQKWRLKLLISITKSGDTERKMDAQSGDEAFSEPHGWGGLSP